MIDEPHLPPPETILFVEDEIFIRIDMAEFLRQSGYRVSEAGSAAEAIDALNAKLTMDLVIADLRMPGPMDGIGLARWIRGQRPGVQVVIQTAETTLDLPPDLEAFGPVLGKPYTGRMLLERVKAALTKAPKDGGTNGNKASA